MFPERHEALLLVCIHPRHEHATASAMRDEPRLGVGLLPKAGEVYFFSAETGVRL